MTGRLSRQQRRTLERAAAGVDHVTAQDRAWFEARPDRQHRIRRMTAAEIGATAAMTPLNPVPPGSARFTLVRKVTPNFRLRVFVHGPNHRTGEEAGEAVAAALWEAHRARSPQAREQEDAMSALASGDLAFRQTEGNA